MRVTLINQFYAPDISPTAQLAASLATHRAAGGDTVTVVTGRAGYLEGVGGEPSAPPEGAGSEVQVHRVWTPDLGKGTAIRRLGGYATFLAGALVRSLLLPRQDVIVAMTTPPYAVLVAVAHRLVHRRTGVVLWSMDCYPDAAERFGQLRPGSRASRLLRALNRWLFRRIDAVVCLDGAMERLLAEQYAAGADRPRFVVVPNWERADLVGGDGAAPPAPASELAARLGAEARTVVAYLGNAGIGHRFDTVLDAAAGLEDEALFAFVGGGARWTELETEVSARGLGNVVLHGYVPKEHTPALMDAADIALITLDDRSLGVMSPSKLHANLAAGLPVLYVGPEGSNVDEAIERFGCGARVRHGDVEAVAAAVRSLRPGTEAAAAAGRRAREAFETAYSDRRVLPRFDAVLDAVAARAGSRQSPRRSRK